MKKIQNIDIKELTESFETPFYVYDAQKIEENYQKISSAFKKYYPKTSVHYAIKANGNPHILKILKNLDAAVDCSSPFELQLAEMSGFSKEKLMYTGNYESESDLKKAVELSATINFDDLNSFKRILKFYQPNFASFRINPGIGRGGFEGITTGGTDAKFGIPYENAYEAYKFAKENGVKEFGIHMMTGSNNLEPLFFAEVVEKLLHIASEIFEPLQIQPKYIDIGGGFGIPYSDEEEELNIEKTAKYIGEILKEKTKLYHLGEPELRIEPGRFIVGNSGYLISKVTGKKEGYRNFVGLDAGMNTLLRPSLYGAFHKVSSYEEKPNERVSICGRICENSDIFLNNFNLSDVEENDIVIFHDAGAYGFVMSSNYNHREKTAEILIANNEIKLIRKREKFEDLIRLIPKE
jgi:diaminopimelate decarboxylase